MRLLQYGAVGQERAAILNAKGQIRDLSAVHPQITGAILSDESLEKIRALDPESLPLVTGNPRIGPCVSRAQKFICVGKNYHDHAAETGSATPSEPMLFNKALSCISGPDDPIEIPRGSVKTDWEVELGVIIGKRAKYVHRSEALSHVAGYCVINDVSERAFQKDYQGQFTKGKSHDTFGPIGPWLVTRDEVPDPQALKLWTEVDGHRYQDGSTADMVFPVDELIAYISRFMTLHPGDILATGTPAGVGLGVKPEPVFLSKDQEVVLQITGLGQQRHLMVNA